VSAAPRHPGSKSNILTLKAVMLHKLTLSSVAQPSKRKAASKVPKATVHMLDGADHGFAMVK